MIVVLGNCIFSPQRTERKILVELVKPLSKRRTILYYMYLACAYFNMVDSLSKLSTKEGNDQIYRKHHGGMLWINIFKLHLPLSIICDLWSLNCCLWLNCVPSGVPNIMCSLGETRIFQAKLNQIKNEKISKHQMHRTKNNQD